MSLLLDFIYPQVIGEYIIYNGNGEELILPGQLSNGIKDAIRSYKDNADLTLFFDSSFNFNNAESKYLAAVYPFGLKNYKKSHEELSDWIGSFMDKFLINYQIVLQIKLVLL